MPKLNAILITFAAALAVFSLSEAAPTNRIDRKNTHCEQVIDGVTFFSNTIFHNLDRTPKNLRKTIKQEYPVYRQTVSATVENDYTMLVNTGTSPLNVVRNWERDLRHNHMSAILTQRKVEQSFAEPGGKITAKRIMSAISDMATTIKYFEFDVVAWKRKYDNPSMWKPWKKEETKQLADQMQKLIEAHNQLDEAFACGDDVFEALPSMRRALSVYQDVGENICAAIEFIGQE